MFDVTQEHTDEYLKDYWKGEKKSVQALVVSNSVVLFPHAVVFKGYGPRIILVILGRGLFW